MNSYATAGLATFAAAASNAGLAYSKLPVVVPENIVNAGIAGGVAGALGWATVKMFQYAADYADRTGEDIHAPYSPAKMAVIAPTAAFCLSVAAALYCSLGAFTGPLETTLRTELTQQLEPDWQNGQQGLVLHVDMKLSDTVSLPVVATATDDVRQLVLGPSKGESASKLKSCMPFDYAAQADGKTVTGAVEVCQIRKIEPSEILTGLGLGK